MKQVLGGFLVAVICAGASAQDMTISVSNLTITGGDTFGGCMMKIDPIDAIADQAGISNGVGDGQCSRGFVTFDCVGAFPETSSRSAAQAKLSAAQLAFVTGGRLFVRLNPNRKHNGYCLADRVDNRSD